jgi:RNA polymerase sigma factor (sigma-70 family)
MTSADERFTHLYQQHYGDIERYVRRRAPDLAVRDVVAEVFLVVWRRPDQISWTHPLPWLYGVARRVLANELRSVQRARALRERVSAQVVGNTADHADEIAHRLEIAAAFDSLSAADQEVLRLVAWEGLSGRDAARAAGCSLTALTMRLNRARRRLRAALGTLPADNPSELLKGHHR